MWVLDRNILARYLVYLYSCAFKLYAVKVGGGKEVK